MCETCDPNRRLMGFSLGYSHAPVYTMPLNFTSTAGGKLECQVFHDCKSLDNVVRKLQNPLGHAQELTRLRFWFQLKKYNIPKSLQFFKSCRTNGLVMEELCVQMARRAEGKKPRLNVSLELSVSASCAQTSSHYPVPWGTLQLSPASYSGIDHGFFRASTSS